MEELGKELKRRRIELGYTIEEISIKTRLSEKNIRLLEQGDIAAFKEDLTYVPYYVKNYCSILNIDYLELKQQLEDSIESYTTALHLKEINERIEVENNIKKSIQVVSTKTKKDFSFISFIVIIILIIMVVAYGIFNWLTTKPPVTTISNVVVSETTPVVEKTEEKPAEVVDLKPTYSTLNNTSYNVVLKQDTANFLVKLTTDSWVAFSGTTQTTYTDRVYPANTELTIPVKKGERLSVRLGVIGENRLEVDGIHLEFANNLNKTIPQTFTFNFVGE